MNTCQVLSRSVQVKGVPSNFCCKSQISWGTLIVRQGQVQLIVLICAHDLKGKYQQARIPGLTSFLFTKAQLLATIKHPRTIQKGVGRPTNFQHHLQPHSLLLPLVTENNFTIVTETATNF